MRATIVPIRAVVKVQALRHKWRRIEYEDDVVPWHCMVCWTYDEADWNGECPGEKTT